MANRKRHFPRAASGWTAPERLAYVQWRDRWDDLSTAEGAVQTFLPPEAAGAFSELDGAPGALEGAWGLLLRERARRLLPGQEALIDRVFRCEDELADVDESPAAGG